MSIRPPSTRAFTVSLNNTDLERRVRALIEKAQTNALSLVKDDQKAKSRVQTALRKRFKPYILEAELIAQQLTTLEYSEFRKETREFLSALVNVVVCPDGRISVLSLTDPRVSYIHRALRGQLATRITTSKKALPIPANTDLRCGVWTAIKRLRRKTDEKKPKVVAFMGPHIDSVHPIHGCGAAAEALSGIGSGLPTALGTLQFGGARNYFRILQESGECFAFDNFATIAGAQGVTIDYTHDLHSQGVIVGLAKAWKFFDEKMSLRENLLRLQYEKKIVMTEFLAHDFKKTIRTIASKIDRDLLGQEILDYQDPTALAYNALVIGKVARELTLQEEKSEFPFLPEGIKGELDAVSQRVLAYHVLRSASYIELGAIKPGKHWLIHHPEQLLRVGPIGADFNVKTIALIETAPPMFTAYDVQSTFALYGLMERFMTAFDVDLTQEARILMVTGGFDPGIYKNEESIEEEYDKVATVVLEDAAKIKSIVKRAILDGAAVVIPMIHHAANRSVIDVV